MKFLIPLLLCATLSIMVTAGHIESGATLVGPREPATLVKGPSSKATVKGPSGPLIVMAGDTGAVSSGAKSGGVVSASKQSPGAIVSTIPLEPALVPINSVSQVGHILPIAPPEYAQIYEPGNQYAHSEELLY